MFYSNKLILKLSFLWIWNTTRLLNPHCGVRRWVVNFSNVEKFFENKCLLLASSIAASRQKAFEKFKFIIV